MYDVLSYKHKTLVPREMGNMGDSHFKLSIVLNYKFEFFTKYNMIMFFKHMRNIYICVGKTVKKKKETGIDSAANSIVFLYNNYREVFVDSVLAHYFHCTGTSEEASEAMSKIIKTGWERYYG